MGHNLEGQNLGVYTGWYDGAHYRGGALPFLQNPQRPNTVARCD